jgi:oligopeptide/dipeptide ABC transporter ATP-binding protein
MSATHLLEIRDLSISFLSGANGARAVDGLSLRVAQGETVCLVGESGSGKSITALSIARLLASPPANYPSGEILIEGRDVLRLTKRDLRVIRGGVVAYIFQEPGSALNPVIRIGEQIKEGLRLHQPELATDSEVHRLLSLVGIAEPEMRARWYPHQMSGGMQQRVMIAMAIGMRPKLLVADEPTTALDVTIQAQVLDLLRDLKSKLGMAILLITHNLGIVSQIADRVVVMYAGQVVEEAAASELLQRPLHPYTRALLKSVPTLGVDTERLVAIGGNVPQPGAWPSGCRFHPRCPQRQADCDLAVPPLLPVEGRSVRCPYWALTPELGSIDAAG